MNFLVSRISFTYFHVFFCLFFFLLLVLSITIFKVCYKWIRMIKIPKMFSFSIILKKYIYRAYEELIVKGDFELNSYYLLIFFFQNYINCWNKTRKKILSICINTSIIVFIIHQLYKSVIILIKVSNQIIFYFDLGFGEQICKKYRIHVYLNTYIT
jgi:hypothetical protein